MYQRGKIHLGVYIRSAMHPIITPEVIDSCLSFEDYYQLTQSILRGETDIEIYKNEKMLRYTQSNLGRMDLVLKNMKLSQKLYNALSQLKERYLWLVISEPWCGDASWGTTALSVIASSTEQIEFKILLRDSYPEIIKHYHTEGSESIPKLVCFKLPEMTEEWQWGPRPAVLQKEVNAYKSSKEFDFREAVRKVHAWYESDMTVSIQSEILDLIKPHK